MPSIDPPRAEDIALRHEMAVATQGVILGEVARLIAHEINQPLAAVAANAGACMRWLRRDPPEHAEAEAAVQRIIADAHRAAEAIRGIQAFLERSPQTREPVRLQELFAATVALVGPVSAARQVQIVVDAPAALPAVEVSRAQMLHVLLSLATNACESLERVPPPRIVRLSAARKEGEVEIGVSDNGPGMGVAGRERHFEPFYSSKPDGFGLGLAVSRTIVESHGGRLWAQANAAGDGETFRFTLPVRA